MEANHHTHSLIGNGSEMFARDRKLKYLLEFTEDEFRDQVVRPILERRGLKFIRDTCGIDEEGKDCLLQGKDQLGARLIYAVQTKSGHLNMSRIPRSNLLEAITQLRTALTTKITLTATKEKVLPDFVMLYTSGSINSAARKHIVDELNDARIRIYDANDLLPEIDELYPELWLGIDAQKFPYLRKLKNYLLNASDTILIPTSADDQTIGTPVSDEGYAPLYIGRLTTGFTKKHNQFPEPKLEQIAIEAVLRQQNYLHFISGEGGSGKTTGLRRIAYNLATEALNSPSTNSLLPIIVPASDIAHSVASLAEVAATIATRISVGTHSPFTVKDLTDGNVCLLIDALDEVGTDERRIYVLAKIAEFHRNYEKCHLVVTARDYGYTHKFEELKNFNRYTMIPIDIKEASKIVDYVSRRRSLPAEKAKEMLRQLHDVHGIALNPLLVTVFVATSDFSKKDIPPNITAIFKKFTEMMLGRWDQRKGLSQQYETDLKDFLLQRIAFTMHKQNSRSMSLSSCRSMIAELLEKRGYETNINVLFDEVVNRSGLLRVEDDVIEFRHHLLQEYFAGRAVEDVNFLKQVVDSEWWRKPIIFYFGEHPNSLSDLMTIADATKHKRDYERFEAAITIGLAVQACYLAEIHDKAMVLDWTVETFTETGESYAAMIYQNGVRHELTAFLMSYVYGRDAVACDPIKQVLESVIGQPENPKRDTRLFWSIVGMIEAGNIEQIEDLIKRYRPTDRRLLLCLHMSCTMISHLRITAPSQKKVAERICKELSPEVADLSRQVIKEMRGLLLEIHRGEVKAIDALPEPIAEGQTDH